MTTVGSLCSGYGGLDLGLQMALGAPLRHAWHVEYDKHPSAILSHHWPDVRNYGDVNHTDWSEVEPVDWLTAGYPCQPFSHAGKRKGADDPRHLWPGVAHAIGVLRPRGVLLENVRGHVSLGLADVLADLSGLGYDATWGVVRAADAGAPHGRARIFIVATAADQSSPGLLRAEQLEDGRGGSQGRCTGHAGEAGPVGVGRPAAASAPDARGERHGRGQDPGGLGHLDSPDAGEARERQRARTEPVDRSAAATADATSLGRGEGRTEPARVVGRPDAALGGLPAVADPDDTGRGEHGWAVAVGAEHGASERAGDVAWGVYGPAIAQWEHVTGRTAPRPTEPARRGERLSPRFVEWMMGLPAGWVTDVPGLPRNAQLKALGNGVVPQQAAMAVRLLVPAAQLPRIAA